MNTKEGRKIQLAFKKLFEKEVADEKFYSRILMYSFLSEVERITDERGISQKELAKMVGTSASYITQLYQGNKIVSLPFLAKLEKALKIDFKITAVPAPAQRYIFPVDTDTAVDEDKPAVKKRNKTAPGLMI